MNLEHEFRTYEHEALLMQSNLDMEYTQSNSRGSYVNPLCRPDSPSTMENKRKEEVKEPVASGVPKMKYLTKSWVHSVNRSHKK